MGSISNLGQLTFIGSSDSGSSSAAARVQSTTSVQDQVQIVSIPPTAQVEQLQTSDPSRFQAVLGDAIRKLRAAALQTTDQVEAAYLSDLANRFQRMEQDGEVAAQPGSTPNLSS